jgi:L-fuconolactonase
LEDYIEATEGINIERMVFVECNCVPSQNEDEVKWVEEIAARDPRIQGIVAYSDLLDERDLDERLERMWSHELVRGIRHNIQFNPPGFALQENFIRGINKVLRAGRHFELCLTHEQLGECVELVGVLPAQPLMLDHCAKPGIKAGEIDLWKKNIAQMAQFENVHCKVSGLLTEADTEAWTDADILPYLDHVRECFGVDRILFGGDWPVSTLAGGYAAWHRLIEGWCAGWSDDERNAFYTANAEAFYRLPKAAKVSV